MLEDEDGEELDFLASGSNVLTIPAKLLANKPKPKPRGSARANLKRQRSSANINFDEDIDEALEEEEDFEPVPKSGKPKKAEKQLMQMATKSETPRDFWDTVGSQGQIVFDVPRLLSCCGISLLCVITLLWC